MPKRKQVHGKEIATDKEKKYAREYTKTLCKVDAYEEAYKPKNAKKQTNYTNALKVHNRDIVQEELTKIFDKNSLTDQEVANIHSRNLHQDTNLNVSQTAVRDYYTVKGYMSKDSNNKPATKVAFIVHGDVKLDTPGDG